MTLYLTRAPIRAMWKLVQERLVKAVKLYPAGPPQFVERGRDIDKAMPVLERMAEIGCRSGVHGEVTDGRRSIFSTVRQSSSKPFSTRSAGDCPISGSPWSIVTTKDGSIISGEHAANLAGSITTHHLIINRNAILVGGIKPHYYCLPVAKRETHAAGLRQAAIRATSASSSERTPPAFRPAQGMRLAAVPASTHRSTP